ncbi:MULTISPECIES: hypothetical protein [Burkholderia]|uniref:hypothetical protein n=1 Tax=Burkholderia TaxID=32008 RepID=UPI0011787923|nr:MULTISPECIES: hypothetical protein [Burkholderia]EKS9798227.1 hypothetical protein [Burkholderia cepacia]EKS9808374.1 hypothetical protein [Burkholderia cepacia]EKS9815984.1 hypothetical protein [Burkholderia cepacia]EKS9823578.1 hypothetical protein [Burkholderia cepacia]EKS9827306.1 hypothetical protein [Burkholderia cepacia]
MKKLFACLIAWAFPIAVLSQTFPVNNLIVQGSATYNGGAQKVDVTGSTSTGTYISGAGIYSFYPTVGHDVGDHQRAQAYFSFVPAQDATISETGIAINANMNTGFAKPWTPSTSYNRGDYLDANGNVYLNTTSGTSASSGSGPSGNGSSIADGSAVWAWQCHDQCNAKMPLFVSAVAGSNAGHVWAGDVDLVLNPGWRGQFAAAWESDMTNNSGADCPGCQNFFATGDAGPNPVQAAYSAYGPSSTLYSWVNGVQVVGTRAYRNAAYYDFSFGGQYGLQLSGSYGTAGIMMSHDFAQMRFGAGTSSNLNRWRIYSGINSTSDGALTFQHSTDNFASNFTNGLILSNVGDATFTGSVILPGLPTNSLPTCNAAQNGAVRYVTDANSPTYNGPLVGGGTTKTLAFCNGTTWTTH